MANLYVAVHAGILDSNKVCIKVGIFVKAHSNNCKVALRILASGGNMFSLSGN